MTSLLVFALQAALFLGSDLPIFRSLTVDSTKPIEAPDFPSYGDPKCDEDGNLFFHAGNGSYDNPELTEVGYDGHMGASFNLSPDLAKSVYFDDFFVSPDGHVYLLATSTHTERLLFAFDKKGAASDPIHLDTPRHLQMQTFVVFNDGSFLAWGFFNDAAPTDMRGKSYAAIFQASGQLAKQLGDDIVGPAKLVESAGHFTDGAATLGDDGSLYLVVGDRVTVLSSAGTVVRRFDFPRLDSEWSITRANISKGLLALTFSRVNKKHAIEQRYLVLSTLSGDVVGWYQPTQETGSINLCFKGGNEFVFWKSGEAGKQYLATAPIK